MSEQGWTHWDRRQITRRTMLRWSARMGVGAAGLALVGCGGDDDDGEEPAAAATAQAEAQAQVEVDEEPEAQTEAQAQAEEEQAEPEEEPEEEAPPPPPVVVEVVALAGAAGSVTLRNTSPDPVDLNGWFLCQRPRYWPMPAMVLGPDQAVTVHAGAGDDSATDVFAHGGFGDLGGSGEMGLFRDSRFDALESMVHYVSWGGGGGRFNQARAAGIWGDDLIQAAEGDVIRLSGDPLDASGFEVEAGGAATLDLSELY